jgi:hypothetical protein
LCANEKEKEARGDEEKRNKCVSRASYLFRGMNNASATDGQCCRRYQEKKMKEGGGQVRGARERKKMRWGPRRGEREDMGAK